MPISLTAQVRDVQLDVDRHHAWLTWYYPGPDERYNWGRAYLEEENFSAFKTMIRSAWQAYERLERAAPPGVTLEEFFTAPKTFTKAMLQCRISTGILARGITPFPMATH